MSILDDDNEENKSEENGVDTSTDVNDTPDATDEENTSDEATEDKEAEVAEVKPKPTLSEMRESSRKQAEHKRKLEEEK